jgi:hypothetical protein
LVSCYCSLVSCHCSLVSCHCSLVSCHCSLVSCHCSLINVSPRTRTTTRTRTTRTTRTTTKQYLDPRCTYVQTRVKSQQKWVTTRLKMHSVLYPREPCHRAACILASLHGSCLVAVHSGGNDRFCARLKRTFRPLAPASKVI